MAAVSYSDLSLLSFFFCCFSVDGWMYCGIAWPGSPSFTFNVTIMKDSYTGYVRYHFVWCNTIGNKILLGVLLSVPSPEKIYWSWTSSLKLWIMRRLSRRKPMKLQGSSVRFSKFAGSRWLKSATDLGVSTLCGAPTTHFTSCVHCAQCFEASLLFEPKQAEHIFIIWCSCKGSWVGPDEKLGLDGHFWQFCPDYCERYWIGSDSTGNGFMHHCSITVPAHICSSLLF